MLGITFVLVSNLLRGRTGRALNAIRTAEPAAAAVGIEVSLRRVLAFTMSTALAAVGGVLYAHAVQRVTPENFSIDLSIFLIIMVIIGGQRSLLGALLGAAFAIGLPEQFREIQDYKGVVYGVILLALIVYTPDGIVGVGRKVYALIRRKTGKAAAAEDELDTEIVVAEASIDEPAPDVSEAFTPSSIVSTDSVTTNGNERDREAGPGADASGREADPRFGERALRRRHRGRLGVVRGRRRRGRGVDRSERSGQDHALQRHHRAREVVG